MTAPASDAPITPIYVKTGDERSFPAHDEPVYYLLTASGLFIGRNLAMGPARFHSIAPARGAPRELAEQAPALVLDYPPVPAPLLASIVGFFGAVARAHGAEAMVLLTLDERDGEMGAIVPAQVSSVREGWNGRAFPIELRYTMPGATAGVPRIIGDIHSHVFEAAYASSLDVSDERHAPGLHIVIGRLDRDPPQFHAEFVVDGSRFRIAPERVMDLERYRGPDPRVPPAWLAQVEIQRKTPGGIGQWTGDDWPRHNGDRSA